MVLCVSVNWSKVGSSDFREGLKALSEPALIDQGVAAIKARFQEADNGTHIVPLSGGLDSRAILAGLLDRGLKDQIIATTYGTPGTYDYDIGCRVAKKIGVKHKAFDLSTCKPQRLFFPNFFHFFQGLALRLRNELPDHEHSQ